MNREIKFRAWVDSMKKMHIWGVNLISINHDLSWESLSDGMFDENDSILMQFTGLKDNNGVEIYEGDILERLLTNGDKRIFKVWSEKGGFVINTHQDDFYKPIEKIVFYEACADMQTSSFIEGNLIVIGNIYQNPELLETVQK